MKALHLLLLAPLASCGLATAAQAPRNEAAQTRLVRALDGMVAGAPQRCLPRTDTNDLEIVGRDTILYRNGQNLVYRNDPLGGCPGLGPGRTIVSTSPGSQTCRGDTVRVVDQLSGTVVGACAFADFVPYRRRTDQGQTP